MRSRGKHTKVVNSLLNETAKSYKELKEKLMITSIIPKCILEEEALVELKDLGVKFDEGSIIVGKCKINCIKVYNLTETQVFEKLETKSLNEAASTATEAELKTYSSRNLAIIFTQLRRVQQIKDKDLRCAATCSLLAAVNSLAMIDPRQASRFLPIIRGIN